MKKIISLILSLAMLVGFGTVLTSCGEPDNPGARIPIYLGEEIYDFDPSEYYVDDNATQVISLVFEPLFRIDEDGDLETAAADDYEIMEDEFTIVVELEETYWSDNVRLTADDFIFAWRNILLNPENANPAAALLFDIENAVSIKNGLEGISLYDLGVTKLDAYTLEIKYRPGADPEQLLRNLASIATAPVRQDKYESSEGFWSKQTGTMVFNGPFQVVELDYDQTENASFKLERNKGYHQEYNEKDYDDVVRPYKLYSFYNPDGSEVKCTYSQIENNTIFYMCDAPISDRKAHKNDATVADTYSSYSYVFNHENPIFSNAKVRQALSLAIDRNAIASAIVFGKAATGFVPSVVENIATGKSFRSASTASISASANIKAAQELLAEPEVKEHLDTYGRSFILTVNDDHQSKVIAELVKAAWEQLGFDVEIEYLGVVVNKVTENKIDAHDSWIQYIVKSRALGNESAYDKNFKATDDRYDAATDTYYTGFDVIAVDWQYYTNDAFVGLASFSTAFGGCGVDFASATQRVNISGWSNLDYNAYITAAYNATSASARASALYSAEKILIEEMPIVPILFNQNFSFSSDELSKVEVDGFGNFVFTDAKLKDYEDYYSRFDD